jgi:hypothetical protein
VQPLLPHVAALISAADDKCVLEDALWALSYLSEGAEDRLLPFLEAGCVPRVCELARAFMGHTASSTGSPVSSTIVKATSYLPRATI